MLFVQLDTDNSGALSAPELFKVLEPFSDKSKPSPNRSSSTDPHDSTGVDDPRVPAELLSMLRHRWAGASYTTSGQNWTQLFNKIDKDHNGNIRTPIHICKNKIKFMNKIDSKSRHTSPTADSPPRAPPSLGELDLYELGSMFRRILKITHDELRLVVSG